MIENNTRIGFSASLSQVVNILSKDKNSLTLCPQGRKVIKDFCETAINYGIQPGETINLAHIPSNWNPGLNTILSQLYGNGKKTLAGFIQFCLGDARLGVKKIGRDGIQNPNILILDSKGLKGLNSILI